MEAQAANDEYTLVNAQGQYTLALTKLSQLLNLPSADGFDIADINEESEAPAIHYEQVLNNWPSIVASKAQIESSKAKVKLARADYYPTLFFEGHVSSFYVNFFHRNLGWGGFDKQFFDNNLNEVVGLHLKVPIFNRFQTRNKIRSAKLDVLNQSLALEDAQQKLRQDIQTAQTNAEVARQKRESAQKSADASAISLSYEQERFDAGKSSVFDLLQARQKHVKARQEAIQAKYELMIRHRILKFYDSF
jgi:outer membrane protein